MENFPKTFLALPILEGWGLSQAETGKTPPNNQKPPQRPGDFDGTD